MRKWIKHGHKRSQSLPVIIWDQYYVFTAPFLTIDLMAWPTKPIRKLSQGTLLYLVFSANDPFYIIYLTQNDLNTLKNWSEMGTSLLIPLTLKSFSAKVYPTNLHSFTLEKRWYTLLEGWIFYPVTHSPSEKSYSEGWIGWITLRRMNEGSSNTV